jgi:Flagellar hook-length control protein FliK
VQIALSGARAGVTLWAERQESAARLRAEAPLLADALREVELEPGDVLVRDGQPPRSAAAAGRFLDRAS